MSEIWNSEIWNLYRPYCPGSVDYHENYRYSEIIEMRLKYRRHKIFVRCFDGVRIEKDSVPQGLYSYHTRHSDNGDVSKPVTVVPEGQFVVVNFCGTIVSEVPLDISEETKITFWSQC